jgi:hypothetical protein
MARTPFFGQGPAPYIARMNMQAATEAGRAYGNAFANLGKVAGDALKTYGENKKKGEAAEMGIGAILDSMSDERKAELASGESPLSKNLQKFMEGELPNSKKEALLGSLVTLDNRDRMDRQEELSRQTAQLNQTLAALGISEKTKQISDDAAKDEFLKGLFTKDESGKAPISKFLTALPEFGNIAIQSPETALSLMQSFQKRIDESGKSAGRTTIVNQKTGKSEVVNLNSKGQPISVVGEAPSQPRRYRTPEEEEQINITSARNDRGLKFADSVFDQAQSSLATKETAKEALVRLDNIETGGLNEAKVGFLKLANSMGVPLSEDTLKEIGDTEAFMSATGNFLFDSIQKTKGSISDSEMKIFRSINPGIVQTKEGNRIMLNYFIAKADRDQKLADFVEELEIDGVSPTQIQREARQWLKDNDLSDRLESLKAQGSETQKPKSKIAATPSGSPTTKPSANPQFDQLVQQVLQKAAAGENLTPDEQRVVDLLEKQKQQNQR